MWIAWDLKIPKMSMEGVLLTESNMVSNISKLWKYKAVQELRLNNKIKLWSIQRQMIVDPKE